MLRDCAEELKGVLGDTSQSQAVVPDNFKTTGRAQAVKSWQQHLEHHLTEHGSPSAICPQTPLLLTLLTHDCTPIHNSKLFIKYNSCGSHQQQ